MKHLLLCCCGSCIFGLTLAQGAWGQVQYSLLFFSDGEGAGIHAFPSSRAVAQRASRLQPTSIASMSAPVSSPYQRWQQIRASQSESRELPETLYRFSRQGSDWMEELLEDLPFRLEQGGISLGQNSPFFLRPDGLGYRQFY
ncbi:MAG: hypothetical protein Q6J46_00815 [Thermostichus sp. DG02_2_bins_29]